MQLKPLLPLSFFSLLLLIACTQPSSDAASEEDASAEKERRVVTRVFPVLEDFYQITLVGSFQLEISEGPCSVTAIGDSSTIAGMRCSVSYGGLTLSTPAEENYDVSRFAMSNRTRVLVSLPELRILANCASGHISYHGLLRTPRLHIGGMGDGSITIDSIACGHFRYECSRQTDACFPYVSCDTAELLTYGTGRTQVGVEAGEMVVCDLSSQGGMDVQARSPFVYVYGRTSGDATFDVQTDEIIIEWQGDGTVTLSGTAKQQTITDGHRGQIVNELTR